VKDIFVFSVIAQIMEAIRVPNFLKVRNSLNKNLRFTIRLSQIAIVEMQ